MSKRYYIDCFGVASIKKQDLINLIEEMLKTGEYDLYKHNARYLKSVKVDDYGMFRQGGKLRAVCLNIINIADDWKKDGPEVLRSRLELLKKD